MSQPRSLFVGVGSPHGDDQVGWHVADRLLAQAPRGVEIRKAATPSQLLDWLAGVERLCVCDACEAAGDEPASPTWYRWCWPTPQITSMRSSHSHMVGLPQVLDLARRLGTLPGEVVVYGVRGVRFEAFADTSPEVLAVLAEIVEQAANDLSSTTSDAAFRRAGHA